jgi:phage terminase large subunit GpA-like protein
MVERGEWRADRPFRGHASFHIWAAYSYSPNATWGDIAAEFLEAKKGGPEKLKTFVNTVLGETWVEKGEAPEWRRLFDRREDFDAVVPRDALFLTAGVDVQADRLVYEVVVWMDDFQSWSLEADVIMGDTAKADTWAKLDELLARSWPGKDGLDYQIRVLAVDSGYNTQTVYNWARKKPRVIACKGSATAKTLLGQPSPVDVKFDGKRIARGCKVWPVGVDMVKAELYGWLRLDPPTDPTQPYPVGYCHFSKNHHGEEFFRQLTAEQRMKHVRKGGLVSFDWTIIPGRQNHFLDTRVYNRAAANRCGLDRIVAAASARRRGAFPAEPTSPARPQAKAPNGLSTGEGSEASPPAEPRRSRPGWLGGRGGASVGRGGDWFRRRR